MLSNLVFDGNFLLHRMMHAPNLAALKSESVGFVGGVFGALRTISMCVSKFTPTRVYVIWDGKKSERRMKIYSDYKGNRVKDFNDPETVSYYETFKMNQRYLDEILPMLSVHTLRLPAYEADDVVYRVADSATAYGPVTVCSDDKDYIQMVRDSISVYRPIKGEMIDAKNFEETTKVLRGWWLFYRACIGDTSDNIEGIPGVGETTILSAISSYDGPAPQGPQDRSRFYAYCAGSSSKRVKAIAEYAPRIERNLLLVDLSQERFDEHSLTVIRDLLKEQLTIDEIGSVRMFQKLEFASFLASFSQWMRPFKLLN